MTDNVVELRPKLECEDIATALRNIADLIDNGAYDWAPTMGVLILGAEEEHRDRDGISATFGWQTHGLGVGSAYAFKGLIATALSDM